MTEVGFNLFFSCSFDDKDKQLVEYFRAVCEGCNMTCVNVDRASLRSPTREAKKLIQESDALIAIATKRQRRTNGKYDMPPSVHLEIGMACGLEKPVLLFVEDGVSVEGLTDKVSTYAIFEREKLWDASFLKKAIRSLHDLRDEVLFRDRKMAAFAASEYYSDLSDVFVTLKKEAGHYIWNYNGTRRLVFTQEPKYPIKLSAWASVPTKEMSLNEHIKWGYTIDEASRKFKLVKEKERESADAVRVSLKISPTPKPGDYIVLSQFHESPFLNPIYMKDVAKKTPFVVLDSGNYLVGDGVLLCINTTKLKIMFCFPTEYGLGEDSFAPYVGTVVGNSILHVVKAEIERMQYDITTYGQSILARLEIDNPMILLQYGLAWNPPRQKK